MYLTPEMSKKALSEMKEFHTKLFSLYDSFNINIKDDTGRRNMLMSSLQEKMFAAELRNKYPLAFANGKTGEPDIIIPEISKELECKLTSKNKSGSWSLQTDYNTLSAKGKLDYLYVLASKDFDEFAVLHFDGLTCSDFFPPAKGSKGKSRMRVSSAMSKCTVLVGAVEDLSTSYLENAKKTLEKTNLTAKQREKAEKQVSHWTNVSKVRFYLEGSENV